MMMRILSCAFFRIMMFQKPWIDKQNIKTAYQMWKSNIGGHEVLIRVTYNN